MTHLFLHEEGWGKKKKKKGADWLTVADDSIFFPEHSVHAATYFEQSGATHCREGKKKKKKFSSLFFPASQMEKQFITLSDSLSKTDMIKNNIK